MAKKRKAGGRPAAYNKPKESERTKFDIEERFDDSGDEFQAGRDQILLDEAPDAKRRRRVAEEEEMLQPSDEEIMGYNDVDVDEDDLDDEDDEEDEGADDYEDYEEDAIGEPSKKPKNKRRDASPGSEDYEDEDEEGIAAWGSSKKDLYNADQIETEADALEEEQEAKRLQQKHLRAMNEADFGFDETEWADAGKEEKDAGKDTTEVTEVLPQVEVTEDMSAEEKLKILKSRYPEFEPLAKDFADLQPTHRDLAQDAKAAEKSRDPDDEEDEDAAPVAVVKFRALSAYLGTISMYFMLLTSSQDASGNPSPMPPAELRGHPVMGSLVKFRKLWESVKDLQTPEVPESEDEEMEESEIIAEAEPLKTEKKQQIKEQRQTKKLSKAERAAQAAQAEAEARRAERLRETEANLADLSTLATDAKKRKAQKTKPSAKNADDSDFGDEDALTAKEAEEKAKQKRSLRFYTSQLAQKANKRSAAGRDAGGDEDLPYRERLKDRQARLNAEAEKRGKKQLSKEEQLGDDSDEEDHRTAQQIRGDQSDSDDYYDMVAARTNQRKDDKKARAEAHAEAARQGGQVAVQEEVGPDGKRAITYQIEKNKGLAPKRNKDVRNPRVKKRKKFEDKKKKLGSIRQQYKGGEGRGGYSGELTGIKKNLVKSVKL